MIAFAYRREFVTRIATVRESVRRVRRDTSGAHSVLEEPDQAMQGAMRGFDLASPLESADDLRDVVLRERSDRSVKPRYSPNHSSAIALYVSMLAAMYARRVASFVSRRCAAGSIFLSRSWRASACFSRARFNVTSG